MAIGRDNSAKGVEKLPGHGKGIFELEAEWKIRALHRFLLHVMLCYDGRMTAQKCNTGENDAIKINIGLWLLELWIETFEKHIGCVLG